MSLPARLSAAVEAQLGRLVATRSLSGGDINSAWEVELACGHQAFVKSRRDAPDGEFTTEAAGLRWLGEAETIAVPAVLAVGEGEAGARFLALELIEAGARSDPEQLGRGLAGLHLAGAPAHGSLPAGAAGGWRIGPLELASSKRADWPGFYAELRLMPVLAMARERGSIGEAGSRAIESLCERIDRLAGPSEPPARLHGDLWSGNVMAATGGEPVLIDPASYGGHREVDLAMLELFGSPGERLYDAYGEVWPLADGYRERIGLWQLLPLLVHAVLFGGPYGAWAESTARAYL